MNLFEKSDLIEFKTLKYIIDNTEEHHITCKINIMMQSDKIDTPYYMDTKIAITHCSETENKGIIHAMDVLSHHRMYNLTEEKYNEMKNIIEYSFSKKEQTKILTVNMTDTKYEIEIRTLNKTKLDKILSQYKILFDKIDELA
ncbi:hypothetical protein [Methanosphaera sp. WGK6]|uniref:hypothetical protein n=1 Tax=Methanosphaera sp. WGK6 TaxID=1561964 RepID=UPI00084CCBBA|nr:hypothetical protein [Methanosphaera sp. WGK6]OED29888.1 hypothetical protein NL43_05595 [Methanosphaera sp. WGK6]